MVDGFECESVICGVKLEEIAANASGASTVEGISTEVPRVLLVGSPAFSIMELNCRSVSNKGCQKIIPSNRISVE